MRIKKENDKEGWGEYEHLNKRKIYAQAWKKLLKYKHNSFRFQLRRNNERCFYHNVSKRIGILIFFQIYHRKHVEKCAFVFAFDLTGILKRSEDHWHLIQRYEIRLQFSNSQFMFSGVICKSYILDVVKRIVMLDFSSQTQLSEYIFTMRMHLFVEHELLKITQYTHKKNVIIICSVGADIQIYSNVLLVFYYRMKIMQWENVKFRCEFFLSNMFFCSNEQNLKYRFENLNYEYNNL